MPALSSTMTEGKILSWVKNEGDKFNKGESVVVVESDKADMDVETFYDDFLAKIVIAEGETAPVGLLAETEEEIAEAKAKGGNAAAAPAAPVPPSLPVEEKAVAAPAAAAPAPVVAVQVAPEPELVRSGRIVATPYAKKLAKPARGLPGVESESGTWIACGQCAGNSQVW